MAFTISGTAGATFPDSTTQTTAFSTPVSVAAGGTNATSYTSPSGNVAGLLYYDGTKLANDGTVTDAGYNTSTHTLVSNNLSSSGNFSVAGYTETPVALGTVSSSATIAISAGTVITATLTASTACTFTMPTATAGKSFILLLKQAASTGNGTATFTGVKWASSGAPTITATAGKMDILTFVSDGTNWYGSYTQGYTP